MIFTRCVLEEPKPEDGLRISVMSRHTLLDGITPDARIKPYDIHIPLLGPSPKLIGSYYKRGLAWREFERQYLLEMQDKKAAGLIQWLAVLAKKCDVTLLCVEEKYEHCHRRLLAEILSGFGVEIEHH